MTDIDTRIEEAKLPAVHELLGLAMLRCETSMLPLLYRVSEVFEKLEHLVNHQGNRDEFATLWGTWNELKQKIRAIERRQHD